MEPFCPQCRPVHEQLQAAFRQEETHRELLRRLTGNPKADVPFPGITVVRSSPTTTGTIAMPGGRLAFWATDPPALESFITQLARLAIPLGLAGIATDDSPSAALARWNAILLGLRLEPPVMLGAIVGWVTESGEVAVARAGLASPILRRGETVKPLNVPGPYLGAYEAEFPTATLSMLPGDELHLPGLMLRKP